MIKLVVLVAIIALLFVFLPPVPAAFWSLLPLVIVFGVFFDAMKRAHIDFGMSQDHDIKNRTERWVQADTAMKEFVPAALAKLAESFRKALGA